MTWKYTPEELASKIDWEGGIVEALEYGIEAKDVEPGPLQEAWGSLARNYWKVFYPLLDQVRELLPEPNYEESA